MEKIIDDAIYNASPDITRRRYNPLLGILLTAASIVMLWANENIELFTNSDVLTQWNLLTASCMLCTGATMICYRLFGDSSAPVEKQSRERLYRSEYTFGLHDLPKIEEAVEQGNFSLLQQLPHSYQPAAQVVYYRTDSGSVIAAQVLKNSEPASEIKVFHKGEYAY